MNDSTFLPIGTLLSRQYKILQHIGAGGFGKTYLVEDQLGEKKVVKEFFISSMCTRDVTTQSVTISVGENKAVFKQQLEKFKEEAHRIYSLSHPNIVKVSALFNENNTAYYVMDYIEGESLAQKSRRTSLTESQIMRYLDQLLSALDYIHSRGITHLDIKPGNIMIDRNDNVVLIDFGASKLFNAQSVNKTMMTSMRPPFTPGYAPIEQENGNVNDMGPHCDIYALGATLYYLYTGEKAPSPFVIFQKGLPQIPQASPLMQKVIKEAMAFDANHRIKNVAEFRAVLSGEKQTIQPIIDSDNTQIEKTQLSNKEVETQTAPSIKSARQKPSQIKKTTELSTSDKNTAKSKETEVKKDKDDNYWGMWKWILPVLIIALITIFGVLITNKKEETITIPGTNVSFKMIKVEGGAFKMGAQSGNRNGTNYDSEAEDDENPVHSVTLSDYYIGETEVTQELWEAVMGNNPSNFKGSKNPVNYVSWDDCQEFVKRLNELTGKTFRLPTETEWEYAARGGNMSRGYKYSGSNNISDVAWYDENACDGVGESSSDYGTHPVGTKSPNELGIYDMSGNVWEWSSDWDDDYSSSSQTNPTGPPSGSYRVSRGGSWNDDAQSCRVANRYNYAPDNRNDHLGLRLVCSDL